MGRSRSHLRNRVEELAALSALSLFRRLGPARATAAGQGAFLLFRRLSRARRTLAERNLARAFPELGAAELTELSRRVFAHFGAIAAELLLMLEEPQSELLARVVVEGEEHARSAFASGRGVFFLTPHLGNWEVAALVTASRIAPAAVIARPLDNPLLERRLRAFRERSGNTVLPKAEAAREILRVIRRGGGVGILIDQHARPPDAVAAPFFGRPAATTTFLARLVDRTEALVLPAVALRTGAGRYCLRYEEAIDPRALTAAERETAALTARFNAVIEALVRRAPEQWLWLHNRWRLD